MASKKNAAEEAKAENTVIEEKNEPVTEAAEAVTYAEEKPVEGDTEAKETEKEEGETEKKPVRKKKAKAEKEAGAENSASEEAAPEEGENGKASERARKTPRGGWKRAVPKEEDTDIDERIKAATDRQSFESEIANASRRRELMSSEHVITEVGDAEVETVATMRNREFQELVGSANVQRVLTGEVVGVRLADPSVSDGPSNGKSVTTVLADILYGQGLIRVSIPSYLFFNYNEDAYKGREGMKDLEEELKHRLGSTIEFVASYVDQSKGECYGDRIRALSMKGSRYYLMPYKPGEPPRIVPDNIVKSRITCVERNAVIVDALGAEIRIPKDELSYIHIGDARDEFTIDDYVNVRILSVEKEVITRGRGNNYTLVKATGSIRQAYPDMRPIYFKRFPVGTLTPGKITQITDDAKIYCSLNGGQIDCMCAYPKFGIEPRVGQKRMIRINERNEEDLHLYGMFVAN